MVMMSFWFLIFFPIFFFSVYLAHIFVALETIVLVASFSVIFHALSVGRQKFQGPYGILVLPGY